MGHIIFEFAKELKKSDLSVELKAKRLEELCRVKNMSVVDCIEKGLYLGIYEMHEIMKYIFHNTSEGRRNKRITRQMIRLYSQEIPEQKIRRRGKRELTKNFATKIGLHKKLKVGFISEKYGNFVSSNEYVRILLECSKNDIEPVLITSRNVKGYESYANRYIYEKCNYQDPRIMQDIVNKHDLTCIVDLSQTFLKKWWSIQDVLILDIWDTISLGEVDYDYTLNNGMFRSNLSGEVIDNALVKSGCRSNFGYPCKNRTFPEVVYKEREKDVVRFGAFCRPGKLSREVIKIWSGALKSVPESEIWFRYIGVTKEQISYHKELFEEMGIKSNRVKFLASSTTEKYLESFNEIDIVLGAAPEGGGISLFDGLAMGKPVIVPMWLISSDAFSQFMRNGQIEQGEMMLCQDEREFTKSCIHFSKERIKDQKEFSRLQKSWRESTIKGRVSSIDDAWQTIYCFIVRS